MYKIDCGLTVLIEINTVHPFNFGFGQGPYWHRFQFLPPKICQKLFRTINYFLLKHTDRFGSEECFAWSVIKTREFYLAQIETKYFYLFFLLFKVVKIPSPDDNFPRWRTRRNSGTSAHRQTKFHVEGPINAIYSEILLSRICSDYRTWWTLYFFIIIIWQYVPDGLLTGTYFMKLFPQNSSSFLGKVSVVRWISKRICTYF